MRLRMKAQSAGEGTAVVRLSGELDVHTTQQFRADILQLLSQGSTRLLIDLSEVSYLDSTGLGALIGALRRIREHGGDMKLLSESHRNRRILQISGVVKVIDLCDTEAEALEQLANT